MCPSTSWSLSSLTRNIVLGRASVTSPSISIFSSFATRRVYPRPRRLPARRGRGRRSDLRDVDGLRALVARFLVIGDLRVLLEGLEAAPVDAGVMHEEVAIAFVRRDEAVPLLVVEPLDGPGRHAFLHPSFLPCPARFRRGARTTTCRLIRHRALPAPGNTARTV